MSQVEDGRRDPARQLLAQAQRGAGSLVRALVRQGEVAADLVEQVVSDVLGRADAQREAELEALRREMAELRARVAELESRRAAGE